MDGSGKPGPKLVQTAAYAVLRAENSVHAAQPERDPVCYEVALVELHVASSQPAAAGQLPLLAAMLEWSLTVMPRCNWARRSGSNSAKTR